MKPSGPNFTELLSTQNLLSMVYQPNFHVIFRISKQKLKTSNKHYVANGNLGGNPVFIGEETSCLANFCVQQLYEIGPILPLQKKNSQDFTDVMFELRKGEVW